MAPDTSALGDLRHYDLFITDTEYDKDETLIGTGTTSDTLTSTITLGGSDYGLVTGDIVRLGTSSSESSDLLVVLAVPTTTTIRVNYQVKTSTALNLYKIRTWLADGVKLDTDIKAIKHIELLAYALVGNAHGGVTDQFELKHDDFYALFIDEIPGTVRCPNRNWDRAFAILPTHNIAAYHPTSYSDARDCMNYLPNGFAGRTFDTYLPRMNYLRPVFKDRNGNRAAVARFHLLFRVWAY